MYLYRLNPITYLGMASVSERNARSCCACRAPGDAALLVVGVLRPLFTNSGAVTRTALDGRGPFPPYYMLLCSWWVGWASMTRRALAWLTVN